MVSKTTVGSETKDRQREKRQLTVLFADLVDSTELGTTLDPEAYHHILTTFVKRSAEIVEENAGFVARFMGDGILAYFGYPSSNETDVQKSLLAALSIKHALTELSLQSRTQLACRIGVATGEVILEQVIAPNSISEFVITGTVANLAARLQSIARRNTIFVSQDVFDLTQSSFRFLSQELPPLKGLTGVKTAFELIDQVPEDFKPWQRASAFSDFALRPKVLAKCQKLLNGAKNGFPTILEITGEAGIGKSTLVSHLMADEQSQKSAVYWTTSDPNYSNKPFHSFQKLFGQDVFDKNNDDEEDRVESAAKRVMQWLNERHSAGQKVKLVIEDMHWLDPSSLALLGKLSAQEFAQNMVFICTSRKRRQTVLRDAPKQHGIELQRLGRQKLIDLFNHQSVEPIAPAIVEEVLARADGIPFFAVELFKHVTSQPGSISQRPLPLSLSQMLAARVSDLGPRSILPRCLAVLGLSADLELVAELSGLSSDIVMREMTSLQDKALVTLSYEKSGAIAKFSHTLLRDAVYNTLFQDERQRLHLKAAETIERLEHANTPREVLANHWLEAGHPQKACKCYLLAGQQYQNLKSFKEAEIALMQGIKALSRFESQPEKNKLELSLQNSLASVSQITHGYSSQQAQNAASRVRTLSAKQGEFITKFAGIAGEWMSASSAGQFATAHNWAKMMHTLATSSGNEDLQASAWMALLTSRLRLGDLIGAEEAFYRGQAFYGTPNFLNRPGAIAQTFGNGALVSALLGSPVAARSRASFAIRNARKMKSEFDLSFATYMAGALCLILGADRQALHLSQVALKLAQKLNFPQFSGVAKIILGRAVASLNSPSQGLETMLAGLNEMKSATTRVGGGLYNTWLCEAYLFAGDMDCALQALNTALIEFGEEELYKPETLRLKAVILKRSGAAEEAAALFSSALDAANQRDGLWFIDRIKMSQA